MKWFCLSQLVRVNGAYIYFSHNIRPKLYYRSIWFLLKCFLVILLGMTDFQVLPPGLNAIPHNGVSVDPKDFQIKRERSKPDKI